MKFSAALFLGASLLVTSPVLAQNAPSQAAGPVAGAIIYDPQGGEIGTIESVTADVVVVNTGTNTVALPPAAVGTNEKGLVAQTTKADLDAAAAQAQAQAQAQLQALLSPGTAVNSTDGQPVGTVKEADPQYVTVTTSAGVDVKLPANAFSVGQTGGLTIAMTAADFNAAVAGSGATAAPAAADAAAPADAATDAAGTAAEGAAE